MAYKKDRWIIKVSSIMICIVISIVNFMSVDEMKIKAITVSNPMVEKDMATWDCIYFGNYYQNSCKKKSKIKWRVLSVNGNEALILSDKVLELYIDYEDKEQYTWEKCSIRRWLNSAFYNAAFNTNEKDAIKMTRVKNEDELWFGKKGGSDTNDKVFLLSEQEVTNPKYGFNKDEGKNIQARQCKGGRYVLDKKCRIGSTSYYKWWLRSTGIDGESAAGVFSNGVVIPIMGVRSENSCGIRPALNIDLSSSTWSYAGKVTASTSKEDTSNENVLDEFEKSSKARAKSIVSSPKVTSSQTTWDCIYFGRYYQSSSEKKEKIKWRVLSVSGKKALVLADQVLDCKPYHDSSIYALGKLNWEDCFLRKWLNSEFIKSAFTAKERKYIQKKKIINENNLYYGTSGGNNTVDKIFLLSQTEIGNTLYGFSYAYDLDSKARQCKATKYAIKNNCYVDEYGRCDWWLRTPGQVWQCNNAMRVEQYGGYSFDGYAAFGRSIGVRPALVIDLSSDMWSYAGRITVGKKKVQTISYKVVKPIKKSKLDKKSVVYELKASACGKGKIIYKNITQLKYKKYLNVNAKGRVTLKKGAPKGIYKVKITATAKEKYKKTSVICTITVY